MFAVKGIFILFLFLFCLGAEHVESCLREATEHALKITPNLEHLS